MKIKKFEGNVKEVSDELNTLEVSNDVQEGAKVEKDDKQSFENFKVLYDKAIEEKCLEDYGTLDDKLKEDTAKEMFLKTKTYIPDENGKVVKSESKKQEGIFNKKEKNSVFSEQNIENYRSVVGGQVYKLITTEPAIRYAEIDDGNINKKGNILTFNVDIEGNAGYDCVGLCDKIKATLESKFNGGVLEVRVSPTDNGDLEISLLGNNVIDVQLVNEDKEKQDKKIEGDNEMKENKILDSIHQIHQMELDDLTKGIMEEIVVDLSEKHTEIFNKVGIDLQDIEIMANDILEGDDFLDKMSEAINQEITDFYNAELNKLSESSNITENKKVEEDRGDVEMKEVNEEIKVQDEKVQKILDEFEHTNNLYKWIVQDMLGEAEGYSNGNDGKETTVALIDYLNDLMSHGCQSGMASSLVFYNDTNNLFDKYEDEVWDFLQGMEETYGKEETMKMMSRDCTATEVLIGADSVRCRVIWSIYEFVANELYEKIEEI